MKSKSEEDTGQLIVYSTLCKTLGMIAVVTFDHNIILHELTSLKRFKQVCMLNLRSRLQNNIIILFSVCLGDVLYFSSPLELLNLVLAVKITLLRSLSYSIVTYNV